jgi:hypothetical protein
MVHTFPFQLSSSASLSPTFENISPPIAIQLFELMQDMAARRLFPPVLGLETIVHVVPFQLSTKVCPLNELREALLPTAIHRVELVQDTALSWSLLLLGFGLEMMLQMLPFQLSTRVCSGFDPYPYP